MRRPVWLAAGMALGVGGTLWAEQRVRRAARRAAGRLAPEQVVADARQSVRQVGDRVRSAVDAGREARAVREAELWDEFGARAGPPPEVGGTRPRPQRAGARGRDGRRGRGRVGAGEAGRLVRMDADKLRGVFTGFFAARGHARVPSASLIPQHPRAPLFTNAGMNQFIPYFLGEELPPYRRATTVQKCVRVRGKHDDIDLVGPDHPAPHLLRDAGQLQLRRLLQGGGHPLGLGAAHRRLGLDGDRLWVDRVHRRRRGRRHLARRRGRARPSASSGWARTTSGRWARPAPAGRARRSTTTAGRSSAPTGGPARRRRGALRRDLEPGLHPVRPPGRRQPRAAAPAQHRHRGRLRAGAHHPARACPRSGRPACCGPSSPGPSSSTGRAYGADAETDVALRVLADHARSTCPSSSPTGCFPPTTAGATCCAG